MKIQTKKLASNKLRYAVVISISTFIGKYLIKIFDFGSTIFTEDYRVRSKI